MLLISAFAKCQVIGKVTAADGTLISYATVELLKSIDSTLTRSAVSDGKGAFVISTVPSGRYIFKISCVGYTDYVSLLNISDSVYNIGAIQLKTAGKQLAEVVIRSHKPLVQQEAGGLVVNPQNSIMTKGSTVLQVLSRSPGVIIDAQTSAISLNGKGGVMVMLNGKLLRLSASQVAALLNGMSADDIDKIELLNTPPAKYDADGNAGLINIVTKKIKKAGTIGSATASVGYGKGLKALYDLSLNHNNDKFSSHFSTSYSHDRSNTFILAQGTENVPIIGGQTAFQYNGAGIRNSSYTDFEGALDYRANPGTIIGGRIYYAISSEPGNSHNFGKYVLPDSTLMFDSQLSNNSRAHYLHPSLYLEQVITKDQKFNIDLDYFNHNTNNPTQVQSNFSDSLFSPQQRNLASSNIKVGVAKLDYTNQFNKQLQLESGLKGTYTYTQSASGIENLVNGAWVPASTGTSNNLATRELIEAAYAILNWQPDSLFSVSAGARYEYVHNSTDHSLNAEYFIDRRLGKLFPSIFITRKLNTTDELQLSYNERITRPSFDDLASYVSYNDPVSVFTGNPALKPTITHNLKLAYNINDYLFSLLYSRDTNPILGVQVMPGPTKGLVYLMPENADWQNNLTLQTTVPVKPFSWWEMDYNFIGGYHQYHVSFFPELLVKGYLSYTLNFTESFKPSASYAFEVSGYYYSPSYYGNSRANGRAIFNLGIKKDIANGNGSFQLSVSDIFRAADYRSTLGRLVTDNFNSNVQVHYETESHFFPIVKLSYTRSFGTSSKKPSHTNDGTKQEQDRL